MRRVRAYSRDERKRLIIHVFAEAIRTGQSREKTCAAIAQKMDIIASTKLRNILDEMVARKLLIVRVEADCGIAGFRKVYELDYENVGFSEPHENRKATKRERIIRLNTSKGREELTLQ